MYCKDCGKWMVKDFDSSWECKYSCLNCGTLLTIYRGDEQGGGTDSYHYSKDKGQKEDK